MYNYFHQWFSDRHYDVVEKSYKERITSEGKKVYSFTWMSEKKVSDYARLKVALEFRAEVENVRVEDHEGKKKTAQKGEVSVTIQGLVERDFQDQWKLTGSPTQHLLREAYDKLVMKGRQNRYETQLGKDLKLIESDIRTYLKTHRYD